MLKLRKILLVVSTAMILPLALISVGYAQELNCWGLRPTRTEENDPIEDSFQHPTDKNDERSDITSFDAEDNLDRHSSIQSPSSK